MDVISLRILICQILSCIYWCKTFVVDFKLGPWHTVLDSWINSLDFTSFTWKGFVRCLCLVRDRFGSLQSSVHDSLWINWNNFYELLLKSTFVEGFTQIFCFKSNNTIMASFPVEENGGKVNIVQWLYIVFMHCMCKTWSKGYCSLVNILLSGFTDSKKSR